MMWRHFYINYFKLFFLIFFSQKLCGIILFDKLINMHDLTKKYIDRTTNANEI